VTDVQPDQAPLRLEDLKRKMKLTGQVKKVELFGAFVDVGAERDGLVHISRMSTKPVNRVEDLVKEGDTVTVWVRNADPHAGRIDLTMIEPLAVEWDELKAGQVYTGKVVKVEKFGAFVDIGAERPGLVHISELATFRVEEVSDITKPGDEVQVKVLGVDTRKRQIKLSIKAIEAAEEVEAEPDEKPMTAMQSALLRAQQQAKDDARRRGKAKNQRGRRDQEDILSRTLAGKRK
jgi:predicted RNA-binding protein with RPS1 domain